MAQWRVSGPPQQHGPSAMASQDKAVSWCGGGECREGDRGSCPASVGVPRGDRGHAPGLRQCKDSVRITAARCAGRGAGRRAASSATAECPAAAASRRCAGNAARARHALPPPLPSSARTPWPRQGRAQVSEGAGPGTPPRGKIDRRPRARQATAPAARPTRGRNSPRCAAPTASPVLAGSWWGACAMQLTRRGNPGALPPRASV
eukprot:gene19566-biopygen5513